MIPDAHRPRATVTRRRLIAGSAGLAVTSVALAAGAPAAGADYGRRRGSLSVDDLAEVYRLKVQYAFGSDAIGAGDVERGLDLYRATFTDDAVVTAGFAGAPPSLEAFGPDDLAEKLAAALAAAGAIGSQHLLGTIEIVEGPEGSHRRKTAAITAYVQATVLLEADRGLLRFLATYHDTAERRRREWRLTGSSAEYLSVEAATRTAP